MHDALLSEYTDTWKIKHNYMDIRVNGAQNKAYLVVIGLNILGQTILLLYII